MVLSFFKEPRTCSGIDLMPQCVKPPHSYRYPSSLKLFSLCRLVLPCRRLPTTAEAGEHKC